MRVGLVCPYSLTLPGGVQGQVLGLARSLRAMGHEARVLGPCDGPPPDVGVTPLGDCVPLAANGSVAPIAPDASCALRTIRALLDALSWLPSDVCVWVGGDGPETEALMERTPRDDRVQWLGRLDDEQVARRLRGADVFCAPSLHGESFGVVLLEAMAAQTPIVASDLPGYRNVARAGHDAILVPPGDAKALAGALVDVLERPSMAESLVVSGEARAAEFSMDLLAERYLELYELAIAAG